MKIILIQSTTPNHRPNQIRWFEGDKSGRIEIQFFNWAFKWWSGALLHKCWSISILIKLDLKYSNVISTEKNRLYFHGFIWKDLFRSTTLLQTAKKKCEHDNITNTRAMYSNENLKSIPSFGIFVIYRFLWYINIIYIIYTV